MEAHKSSYPIRAFPADEPAAPSLVLFTVVNGIPFYRSSGQNSGHAHTWLPFLGIRESTEWFIKPKSGAAPELTDFFAAHKIHEAIALNRLGNVQAMCISASIGGGFWDKSAGQLLKEYLQTHYPELFLQPENTACFNAVTNEQLIPLEDWNQVNAELRQMGALMPLDSLLSRLPSPTEIEFFHRPDSTTDVKRALSMCLVQHNELNEAAYETILSLSQHPLLFRYALENYLFEDAEQLVELQKIMHVKGDNIEHTDLIKVNQLRYYSELQKKSELIHYPVFRQALRILTHNENGINPVDLEVLITLFKNDLLDYSMKLLNSTQALDGLRVLSSTETLSKENINLISLLHHQQLLNKPVFLLLLDEDALSVLKKLAQANALTQNNIELLVSLDENYLLDAARKILKNDTARSILFALHKQDDLSKKNIKLITKIQKLGLLNDAAELFTDAASRKFLIQLCTTENPDTDAMAAQISARKKAFIDKGNIYSSPNSTLFEVKERDSVETPVKNTQKPINK